MPLGFQRLKLYILKRDGTYVKVNPTDVHRSAAFINNGPILLNKVLSQAVLYIYIYIYYSLLQTQEQVRHLSIQQRFKVQLLFRY